MRRDHVTTRQAAVAAAMLLALVVGALTARPLTAQEAEKEAAARKELERKIQAEVEAAEKAKAAAAGQQPLAPAAPQVSAYEKVLTEHKIEATSAGIRDFLLSLHPGPETQRALETLVQQLGEESFAQRETAMSALRSRSIAALETLQASSNHTDPEIRWRANKLLELAAAESDSLMIALFKTVESKQLPGLAAPIISTLPLCTKDHVRHAARRAMAVTALPEDLPLLKQELKNADPQVRIAVLGALANVEGPAAADSALELAGDDQPQVVMAVARLLSQEGRNEALPLLVKLLEAEKVDIRGEAGRTLKAITEQDFGFVAYDDPAVRAVARDKWQAWLASAGKSANLRKLDRSKPFELGRLLLCSYGTGKIMEYDVEGKNPDQPRWEVTMGMQPWAVQGLSDGRRLVALYGGRKLVEFGPEDNAREPIWESEPLPGGPMGMHRLENGNTVVACTDANLVCELDGSGKIIRKWTIGERPVDVQRLDNGNTLVALQTSQKVVEIDGEGKVVWSTSVALQMPFAAQRLPNGNTLVAVLSAKKVVEVSPDGKREEWSVTDLMHPYHARRLETGNTLVVDQQSVQEIDTESKKVLWKLSVPNVSRASRF